MARSLQLRVAGVDARKATTPDPRPPRWWLAGYCQLDPSHPAAVEGANHVFGVPESGWFLPRSLFPAQMQALQTTSLSPLAAFFVCLNAAFLGFV